MRRVLPEPDVLQMNLVVRVKKYSINNYILVCTMSEYHLDFLVIAHVEIME